MNSYCVFRPDRRTEIDTCNIATTARGRDPGEKLAASGPLEAAGVRYSKHPVDGAPSHSTGVSIRTRGIVTRRRRCGSLRH